VALSFWEQKNVEFCVINKAISAVLVAEAELTTAYTRMNFWYFPNSEKKVKEEAKNSVKGYSNI